MIIKFKFIFSVICLIILANVCSCGNGIDDTLPSNPIVFESRDFTNPDNSDDGYTSILYNNRVYIPYGTLDASIDRDDIEACIGYIKDTQNPKDTSVRVYTLKESDDYLMSKISDTVMDQPVFFRALDTKNKNINTPRFISSLEYEFWE